MIPDVDNMDWEESFSDVEVCMLYKQLEVMSSCCWKVAFWWKICNSAVVDIVKDLESFDHISSSATVY